MPFYAERMILLKFYPFRLFDVLAPMTAAMLATQAIGDWLANWVARPEALRRAWASCAKSTPFEDSGRATRVSLGISAAIILVATLWAGEYRRELGREPTPFDTPEWLDVCRWVRENTPADTLAQTPIYNPDFKWHAQRAEFVNYKDMPQDNRSLIEWNRRLRLLNHWYRDHYAEGVYANSDLRDFRSETGISLIVADRLGPFELPARYTNRLFRVYDLTELDDPN
jgi:hypothetical protein